METGRRLLVFRLILMIKVDGTESKVVEVAATLAKFSQVEPIVQRVVQWKIVNIQADELTSNTEGNKELH